MLLDIDGGRASSRSSPSLDALGLSGPPEPLPPRHDRLHRHRVLQARDRRDQADGHRRGHRQLEQRLAGIEQLPHPISLHVNGCPNSCARIQTADIGLKGQLLPDGDGGQTPGFQVHLGGGLASHDRDEAGLGRTVRGLKVTADGLADYVERVVRRFLEQRDAAADETFAEWAHRVDEEVLR